MSVKKLATTTVTRSLLATADPNENDDGCVLIISMYSHQRHLLRPPAILTAVCAKSPILSVVLIYLPKPALCQCVMKAV